MADKNTIVNSNFLIKFIVNILFLLLFIYVSTSFMVHLITRKCNKKVVIKNSSCGCDIEEFDGNTGVNYIDSTATWTYARSKQSNFQSVALTSPDTQDKTPSNLMGGTLNRFIVKDTENKDIYLLEVLANLYVLFGNIYDEDMSHKIEQSYKVYLVNDQGKKLSLGELQKDNDGLYKLRVKTENTSSLEGYDKVEVVYHTNKGEQLVLEGQF